MDPMLALYGIVVALAGGLVAIAIRGDKGVGLKAGALVLAAGLMATAYAGYGELLGRAKPVSQEWFARDAAEATVLASQMREGEAIFLWLRLEGDEENPAPRAYRLPWSEEAARELHKARRQAEAQGTELRMRAPFKGDPTENEPVFHAAPPPRLPPKTAAQG